jgi:hypothetical protein
LLPGGVATGDDRQKQKQRPFERSGARAANHLPPAGTLRGGHRFFYIYISGRRIRPPALCPLLAYASGASDLRRRGKAQPSATSHPADTPRSNPSAPAHARSARPFPSPTHGDALRPPPRRRRRLLQGMAAPASVLFPPSRLP